MTVDFVSKFVVLKLMFHKLSKLVSDGKYIVIGQICIAKDYRKQGVFRVL